MRAGILRICFNAMLPGSYRAKEAVREMVARTAQAV